jgi:hypothetical protein
MPGVIDPKSSSFKHGQYQAMEATWKMCRDAATGQRAIHKAGETYLPALSGQSKESYNAYLKRALFYGATGRTVDGMVGLVFRKKPVAKMPAAMEAWAEDINLAGRSLDGLARDCVTETIKLGRLGLLVDHPSAPETEPGTQITMSQAEMLALRPYLVTYSAEKIMNWRAARVGNVTRLVFVMLEECYDAGGGEKSSIGSCC